MKKFFRIALAAGLSGAALLCADPSFARPGMGGGMGGGFGISGGMGGFGAHAMGSSQLGGFSGSHISAQGSANTNGPNALDRDTGLDRAQDRMSDQGIEHNKAEDKQTSDGERGNAPPSAAASTSVK